MTVVKIFKKILFKRIPRDCDEARTKRVAALAEISQCSIHANEIVKHDIIFFLGRHI